jgi:hypothetical protein
MPPAKGQCATGVPRSLPLLENRRSIRCPAEEADREGPYDAGLDIQNIEAGSSALPLYPKTHIVGKSWRPDTNGVLPRKDDEPKKVKWGFQ